MCVCRWKRRRRREKRDSFLEDGDEEKGKEKGESDSTGQQTDQPNKCLCSVSFTVNQFDSIYIGE